MSASLWSLVKAPMMASTIKLRKRLLTTTLLLLAASAGLHACGPAIIGGTYLGASSMGAFDEAENRLIEKNYAAADYLIQQADAFINRRYDLIQAEPLADSIQPLASPDINRRIPEQIGVRLSQLGYRMDLSKVAGSADTNYLKPTISKGEKPDFILSGNSTRRGSEMDVSIRIVDIKAQRVVAAFDYFVDISNRDLRESATPKPKIIRMTDQ